VNARLAKLLENPRLRLRTADHLSAWPVRVSGQFPIAAGEVHEWFLSGEYPAREDWYPPVTVMAGVAKKALENEGRCGEGRGGRKVVWIGRRCWPAFQLLKGLAGANLRGGAGWLSQGLFLDPATASERYWAIGEALACRGVGAVIADGSGINAVVSRRLQLAAEAGKVLGLIARPPWEMGMASHAAGRWEVRSRETRPGKMGWVIKLASPDGSGQRGQDAPSDWTLEWTYQVFRGTGALDLSPLVGHGVAGTPGWRERAG